MGACGIAGGYPALFANVPTPSSAGGFTSRPVGVRLDRQGALLVADDVGNAVGGASGAIVIPGADGLQ